MSEPLTRVDPQQTIVTTVEDAMVHRRSVSLVIQLPGGEQRLSVDDPTIGEFSLLIGMMDRLATR